jgi:hypothetical protein
VLTSALASLPPGRDLDVAWRWHPYRLRAQLTWAEDLMLWVVVSIVVVRRGLAVSVGSLDGGCWRTEVLPDADGADMRRPRRRAEPRIGWSCSRGSHGFDVSDVGSATMSGTPRGGTTGGFAQRQILDLGATAATVRGCPAYRVQRIAAVPGIGGRERDGPESIADDRILS